MVEEKPNPEVKRRRLEDEQRTAFQEDMARVRAAMATENAAGCAGAEGSNIQIQAETALTTSGAVQQQHLPSTAANGGDSDDEGGGNWLKKFTAGHTRIGEKYQVTDLPVPSPKMK